MTFTTMQFDILTYIERYQDKFLDVQTISDKTHYSVEDVEATLKQLVSEGLLDEKQQVVRILQSEESYFHGSRVW